MMATTVVALPRPGTDAFYKVSIGGRWAAWAATAERANQDPYAPTVLDPKKYFTPAEWTWITSAPQGGANVDVQAMINAMGGGYPGGGGGGGVVFVGGGQPTLPQLPRNIDEAKQWIREHYGAFSWALDHAELGPLLTRAAMEGWSDGRLQDEVQHTNWWKTTTPTMREWDAFVATDPNGAHDKIDRTHATFRSMARQVGVETTDLRLRDLATKSLRMGWTAEEAQRALAKELVWDGSPIGQAGERTTRLVELAAEQGVRMSNRTAFGHARNWLMGNTDEAGLSDMVRDQARALFPHLSPQLDKGVTVRQIADPYIQSASQLLERGAQTIDITDPLFQRPLRAPGQGGGYRLMELPEWQSTLMSDNKYGWDATANARSTAYDLVDQLGSIFGRA